MNGTREVDFLPRVMIDWKRLSIAYMAVFLRSFKRQNYGLFVSWGAYLWTCRFVDAGIGDLEWASTVVDGVVCSDAPNRMPWDTRSIESVIGAWELYVESSHR